MGVTVEIQPLAAGSRAGVSAVATVDTSMPVDLDGLYDALEVALVERGLGLADVMRTRLFASSRAARDAASVVRFRRLSGAARCATSSYIEEGLFPSGDGVRVDAVALAGAGNTKLAVEYEPRQPPCRYVASGDQVFLSGVTSTESTFDAQLRNLAPRLAETLRLASHQLGRPVRPIAITAYVHRSVDLDAFPDLPGRLGMAGVPLTVGRCNGYSSPGKLVEVEVNASAAPAGPG